MSSNQLILKKENIESFQIEKDIKTNNKDNNPNQKELSQMFNNLYDSNFLLIINELSSQIQSFYKSSVIHYNIINSFLSQNENKEISNLTNIKNSFNTIETVFFHFYSTAKILFKKMKIYRSEKIKYIRHYSLNNIHKKQTITFNKEKKNIPSLNLENIKDKTNNLMNNNNNDNDKAKSSRTEKKLIYLDNSSNESNINSNSNSNNNFSQSCNTTIDKESNILIIEDKNQHSNTSFIEFINNINKEIKILEEKLLSLISEYNNDKINDIINITKNIKDNLNNVNIGNENIDKKIINNLYNKINILIEENNKIKKQFEIYKNEEKIKRKFFENQIFILSYKNNENEKNKKNEINKSKEMKNKIEEIKNLNNNIRNINIKLNDELRIKTEKINEMQNIIDNQNQENNLLKETLINIHNQNGNDNNEYNKQIINQINNNKIEFLSDNNEKYITNKINPENYSIIKVYQLNSKLKWVLLKKNIKHIIKYIKNTYEGNQSQNTINKLTSLINYNSNINNIDSNEYNYNDFIWIPYKEEKNFDEFGDISLFIEKEKDYDNIIIKLNQKIKIYENEIDKLKIENYNLNNIILKYKNDEKNIVGISFIEEDPESSKFIDDKGCEDILIGLDKNKNKGSIYNIKLKNNIEMFMKNKTFSENDLCLFSNILKKVGCSDEDVIKLIDNKINEI